MNPLSKKYLSFTVDFFDSGILLFIINLYNQFIGEVRTGQFASWMMCTARDMANCVKMSSYYQDTWLFASKIGNFVFQHIILKAAIFYFGNPIFIEFNFLSYFLRIKSVEFAHLFIQIMAILCWRKLLFLKFYYDDVHSRFVHI